MKRRLNSSKYIYGIEYIFNVLWLIRIPIVSVSILLLINAFVLSGVQNVFFPCISTMCMLFFGYVINDILDVKIDIISAPDRPIPSGKISLRVAKWIGGFFGGLALIFALLSENILFVLYIVTYAVMFWIYTKHLKRNWLIKNGVTALFFSSLALIPVIFEKSALAAILPLFAVSFVFTLGREILMDIKDSAGDNVIPGNIRIKVELGWVVSTVLIVAAFLLMEIMCFETYVLRYIVITVVCASFTLVLRNKKKKIWLCAEIIKLWFLINLFFLLVKM